MESLATCFDSLYLTGVMDPQQADEMFHSLGVVVFCSFGVLGAEPLGEGVASNEVRARGRLSPSNYFK